MKFVLMNKLKLVFSIQCINAAVELKSVLGNLFHTLHCAY